MCMNGAFMFGCRKWRTNLMADKIDIAAIEAARGGSDEPYLA